MLVAAWCAFALFALVNWWAVTVRHTAAETLAKPLTLLALITVALAGGAAGSSPGRWLLAALVLCLTGDIFLLGDSEPRFLLGLASFLLGHAAYIGAFVALGLTRPSWGWIGLALVIAGQLAARPVLPAVRREGLVLLGAVVAYMSVIGAMVITAWITGHALIGIGAAVFMASDTILALDRFVTARRYAHLAVMATYHLGQAAIVAGLLRAVT